MTAREYVTTGSATFLAGGLIGSGLVLLFAPSSGKETRDKLSKIAEDVKDKAKKYATRGKEKMKESIEKGTRYYHERKRLVTSPVEACMDAYSKERKRLGKTN